ncbi:MAG: hypothetical protein IJ985_06135, partial [Akkermansia sp.]|nr:hypothetical protein [Akkermansia sp.]
MFLCGALFCVSLFFNDENKVDAAWVEQNFSLPCAQLGVRQATFDVDLNIATLALNAPPPDSYWETLFAAGWHPVHEKGLVYATKDDMMLDMRMDYVGSAIAEMVQELKVRGSEVRNVVSGQQV